MTIFTKPSHSTPRTRTRNRTIVGVSLSILVHVLLFVGLRPSLQKINVQASSSHEPLEVTFVRSTPPPAAAIKQPTPPEKPQPVKKPSPQPKQVARAKPSPSPTPSPAPVREAPSPSPTAITQAAPEMDMSTMLNAARERRRAAESSAARENAEARAAEQGPSANEIARANIDWQARKASGPQNGMFEIISKGPRVAQYLFMASSANSRNKTRRTITVEAGLNEDIEKAIVNSMIALIRRDVANQDFIFESHKLGRSVVLSARVEDTVGLQDFLMREFFG